MEAHLFSTMERGMEFMFCKMGTRRSTIPVANGASSSGFSFTAISPAHTMPHYNQILVSDLWTALTCHEQRDSKETARVDQIMQPQSH